MSATLYDLSSGNGTTGRARARRDQVIAMSHSVVRETDEELAVRRWFSDEVSVWRRLGTRKDDLWELVS
ncbi:MAG: hypothetical protein RL199_1944 [Pseudomonadota bacterium]